MKRFLILMAALLVALAGCEKEPQAVKQQQAGEEIGADDKVYMALKIQAVDTRSGSDGTVGEDGTFNGGEGESNSDATPDIEVGSVAENTITSIQVVLKNDEKFIIASATPSSKTEDGATTDYKDTWVASFNSSSIAVGDKFDVYIYANCAAQSDVDATSTETIDNITTANKFWMTNAYEPTNVEIKALSTKESEPTDLGTHFIERSMARFDYMAVEEGNKYDLTIANTGDLSVTLTHAAIINQSKEFYYLRRATKGTTNDVVIGYPELRNNFVVDTDWNAKSSANSNQYADIADHFEHHITTDHSTWNWKELSSLTNDDNWPETDGGTTDITPTHGYADYKIFGYVKENTLPDATTQVNGMSTGVVFKGKITGDLVTEANGTPIYMYDNTLYGTWDKVVAAAENNEVLKHFISDKKFGTTIDDSEREALAAAGFTSYSADTDGNYYTYYYYWNRHNDNGNNKEMGNMEFAVVRNNVYKLCVDYITKLGHPTPGQPDPDPIEPGDPDESGEYYFGVTAKVVPWVVRVNHIGW